MKRKTLDLLVAARNIIWYEHRWTQSAGARDQCGVACDPTTLGATQWCALGSLYRAADERGHDAKYIDKARCALEKVLIRNFDWDRLSDFNDNNTHEQVKDLFTITINKANKKLAKKEKKHG